MAVRVLSGLVLSIDRPDARALSPSAEVVQA